VQDTIVDVIGICKSTNDLVQITSRAGKELTKREITLVDQSSTEVRSQHSHQLCVVQLCADTLLIVGGSVADP
jgi:hypothetical protein